MGLPHKEALYQVNVYVYFYHNITGQNHNLAVKISTAIKNKFPGALRHKLSSVGYIFGCNKTRSCEVEYR